MFTNKINVAPEIKIILGEDYNEILKYNSLTEDAKSVINNTLVNRLLQNIKSRYENFDIEIIRKSQGDITKMKSYEYLVNAHSFMKEVSSNTNNEEFITKVITLEKALNNLVTFKHQFMNGYATDNNLISMTYELITVGLFTATSTLLGRVMTYIREGSRDETLPFRVNNKRNDNELAAYISNLERFNNVVETGSFLRFFKAADKENNLNEDITALAIAVGSVIAVFLLIMFILRTIAYFYYKAKQGLSDYMSYLAEFTRNNIHTLNPETQADIIRKQESVISKLNSYSKKLNIDMEVSSKSIDREIKTEDKVNYVEAKNSLQGKTNAKNDEPNNDLFL